MTGTVQALPPTGSATGGGPGMAYTIQTAMAAEGVRDATAAALGSDPETLADRVSVGRSDGSPTLSVTWSGPRDRAGARDAVRTVLATATLAVYRPAVAAADADLAAATDDADDADRALVAARAAAGTATPDADLAALLGEQQDLLSARTGAPAPAPSATADARLARVRAAAARLRPLVADYDAALADLRTADGDLARARQARDAVGRRLAAATSADAVAFGSGTAAARPGVVHAAVLGGVGGLLLGVVLAGSAVLTGRVPRPSTSSEAVVSDGSSSARG